MRGARARTTARWDTAASRPARITYAAGGNGAAWISAHRHLAFSRHLPGGDGAGAAREIEALGFRTLWIPEALGREVFTHAAILLAGTERFDRRDRNRERCGARRDGDGGGPEDARRGVSRSVPSRHGRVARAARRRHAGHAYEKPLTFLRGYLDAMDAAVFMGASPATPPPRRLASLHPKSLELARDRAWGSHPYFVPPEHTRRARAILGPGKLLAPEQMVCFETDPSTARAIARQAMQTYLGLPNYVRNLPRARLRRRRRRERRQRSAGRRESSPGDRSTPSSRA